MTRVLIDMNQPTFQKELFNLEKLEQRALLNTLRKISQLSWGELYQDKGIRWELIVSKKIENIDIYSFRFSQKYRGTAYRDGSYFVLLNLFTDHDSTYLYN